MYIRFNVYRGNAKEKDKFEGARGKESGEYSEIADAQHPTQRKDSSGSTPPGRWSVEIMAR